MRLWVLGRRNRSRRPGGDQLQIMEGAEWLRARGWQVSVCDQPVEVQPAAGDLVHLINIQRCFDWDDLPERVGQAGARLVISPLFHLLDTYHRAGRRGLDGLLSRCIPDLDRYTGLRWGRSGLQARGREVLCAADRILSSGPTESTQLAAGFGLMVEDLDIREVPVAVPGEEAMGPVDSDSVVDSLPQDFVLCSGRIEPLKNPTDVAQAAADLELPVRFAGARPPWWHLGYGRSITTSSDYLGPLEYSSLRAVMARARVHVCASWTEVVGRVSLEAALSGAAVVATDVGGVASLLGRDTEGLFLFQPGDPGGLRSALEAAWARGRRSDGVLVRRVRDHFTWSSVGPQLHAALQW